MAEMIRLDKYLSDMGIGTRSEIKTWIRKGRVTVNQTVCRKPETKITIGLDRIYFDNHPIHYHQYHYFILHKPAGVVSATTDNFSKTVLDLIKEKNVKNLFPMGRLDKDTEGLLLITNDGDLAHQLLSPKKRVDKVYYAKIKGMVTSEDIQSFLEGVRIGDYKTLPAQLKILHSDTISEIELTIQEGKFHQVKRMFQAVGKEVLYLKRLSMGGLSLDPSLQAGEYRELTDHEVNLLRKIEK